jgi:CBS domain-containing protein
MTEHARVRDYMTKDPLTLREDDLLRQAVEIVMVRRVRHIPVLDGRGGLVGSTTFRLGLKIVVPGVAFDVLRPEPDVRSNSVRFVQTVGGRAGFPAPRRVSGKPFFRIHSATAWTTLGLTIGLDGTSFSELLGASAFPRHWVYDHDGNLVKKSGTVDFKTWYREAHGENTPWGDEESDAFVTSAESALEREISRELMTSGIDMACHRSARRHPGAAGRARRRPLPPRRRSARGGHVDGDDRESARRDRRQSAPRWRTASDGHAVVQGHRVASR